MDRYNINIPTALSECAADLKSIGSLTLEAQLRAYDLLDAMMEDSEKTYRTSADFAKAAESFIEAVTNQTVEYNEDALKAELESRLAPLEAKVSEARFKAAAAESLHEFAKETYEIWKTSGIFARRRALKELRKRAGFQLESHRIGNYVAKTYDLMNEAYTLFAKAQQAFFSANLSYKIKPGVHQTIKMLL